MKYTLKEINMMPLKNNIRLYDYRLISNGIQFSVYIQKCMRTFFLYESNYQFPELIYRYI